MTRSDLPPDLGQVIADLQRRVRNLEQSAPADYAGIYDYVDDYAEITSSTWGNVATSGPSVSGVRIGPSGRALVTVSALMYAVGGSYTDTAGYYGFEMDWTDEDGVAQSMSPSEDKALSLFLFHNTDVVDASVFSTRSVIVDVDPYSDLDVTAKYRHSSTTGGISVQYRSLLVQSL